MHISSLWHYIFFFSFFSIRSIKCKILAFFLEGCCVTTLLLLPLKLLCCIYFACNITECTTKPDHLLIQNKVHHKMSKLHNSSGVALPNHAMPSIAFNWTWTTGTVARLWSFNKWLHRWGRCSPALVWYALSWKRRQGRLVAQTLDPRPPAVVG